MRFLDYMKLSSDTEESIFRSLNIDIVDDDDYINLINKLSEKYEYISDSMRIIKNINKHFKKYYGGSKYKYGFCIENKKSVDNFKINKKQKEILYKKYYNANNEFENIKKQFENDILYDKYLT